MKYIMNRMMNKIVKDILKNCYVFEFVLNYCL